jgi:hypothetical protein
MKKLLYFTAILLISLSCQVNDNQPNPINGNELDKGLFFSLDDAKNIALKGITNGNASVSGARIAGNVKISSAKTYNSDKGNPMFHIIKFADKKGFRVISADKSFVPLFAHSDSGEFDETIPGISQWFNFLAGYLPAEKANLELKQDKKKQDAIKKLWVTFEETGFPFNKKVKGGRVAIPEPDPNQCTPQSIFVNRLVNTTWGQGRGFNYYFPPNSCGNTCSREPAGCGAIAMSQIIRANAVNGRGGPSGYNFGVMPGIIFGGSCDVNSFSTEELQTGIFVRNVANAVGSFSFTISVPFFCTTSTATYPWGIPSGFSQMGYSNGGNYGDFFPSYGSIVSDIANGYPVIMSGKKGWFGNLNSWHIWIIDGIDRYFSSDCSAYEWFRCNWGWYNNNGENDAWYWYGNGNYNGYDTELRAVTSIRP